MANTAHNRPYAGVVTLLKNHGLRPTKQRLALARLLFDSGHRHLTAEQLQQEAREAGIRVALATIYNTLHQFTAAGLLREVTVDANCSWFDTNTDDHHHFLHEADGRLEDIPADAIELGALPAVPDGKAVSRVDVIIRVADKTGQ